MKVIVRGHAKPVSERRSRDRTDVTMGKSKPSAQSSYYVCKLRKPAVGAAATKFRIARADRFAFAKEDFIKLHQDQ